MPRTSLLCIALICAGAPAALCAADNALTAEEKAAGWRLLFDGRTFANWVDPAKQNPPGDSFTIEDGCLKAKANPRIAEELLTLETFRDFEMEWDWKISPAGNSGVKYLIQDHLFLVDGRGMRFDQQVNASLKNRPTGRPAAGTDYVIGFEYQLIDNQRAPDGRTGPIHQSGALYDVFGPAQDVTKPVGEFNHSHLVIQGNRVEHWLNGVRLVDAGTDAPEIAKAATARWGAGEPVAELLGKHPRRDCPISLQNHGDDAWFKNIKIRVPRN